MIDSILTIIAATIAATGATTANLVIAGVWLARRINGGPRE
ncbi:hypothetical protein [Corynebacterium diphtheriae]|nr:hypothetical protein [Corynebacterium diphtheriae]UWE74785.1 hypothetical protein NY043_08320 [Corynebacterium diphtheriae bv. gravis]UWE80834.1 hypothetical protein NY041_06130 [Corynebacterium diphtheriae bv. gravis]UWE85096.1 hypothetical protein NY048_06285 [Corynebacterium diphtheriae bv. gravis]UWE93448.1 hypothetical protein NY031_06920 [Corynebacterium diphtheriae bv. gravis]UWF02301.1 hypothetical protein NY047_08320 [Corynebacterium diphtheriae bv. gravis]